MTLDYLWLFKLISELYFLYLMMPSPPSRAHSGSVPSRARAEPCIRVTEPSRAKGRARLGGPLARLGSLATLNVSPPSQMSVQNCSPLSDETSHRNDADASQTRVHTLSPKPISVAGPSRRVHPLEPKGQIKRTDGLYYMNEMAEALKDQGLQLVADGHIERGIECFTDALAQAPQNPLLLCNRSGAYSMLSPPDWCDSYKDAVAATREDPLYWKAWSRRGIANLRRGNPRSALKEFEEAKWLFRYFHPLNQLGESLKDGLHEARRMIGSTSKDSDSRLPPPLPTSSDDFARVEQERLLYRWNADGWPPSYGLGDVEFQRPARCRGPNDRIGMSYKFRRQI